MRRSLAASLLLLGLIQVPGTSALRANDAQASDDRGGAFQDIAALITAAQGTFPAAQLPLMCVSIHQATATPAQNLKLLQKIGAHCARSDNNWNSIEREGAAGTYQWDGFDDFWPVLCRAGIKPIMIVTYNNPIYAAGVFRPIVGGANIAAYQNFAVAIADHFISTCPNMVEELFNEPSANNWTTVPWSGKSYAQMLAPVSAAIKKAQPRVTVYSGGIGIDPDAPGSWIKDMVSAGLRFPAVDAYGLHPYDSDEAFSNKTPPPEKLLVNAAHFAEDAAGAGQGKPIANTEYGFSLPSTGDDPVRQGIYVARGMLASIIGKYPLHTHYDLIDDGVDQTDHENTFGLFRNGDFKVPYEMKPAGRAFSTITSAMAKAKTFTVNFDAALSAPSIAFEKPGGTAFVIWTYDRNGSKSYEHPIGPFKQISCKDVLGKSYPCRYAGGTLSLSLTESGGPVVVTALR